ncbi:NADH-quinone oxidoreductase subunit L [Halopseudomonas salegens]|uniref:Probable inorganic carbon transporter subunit DabB n=1 Tax=Halopseudomonas salegens TaxID=1434072 RepID=A0A1H2ENP1_9GAMM|nr:NADH-quinone oxidoreductase subunit L [Halopseudomonas salegens]SDT96737.1 NAD(P)H-quinone oxidoreductase subunit 5 [Halopseudomonas salegens]
MPVLPFSAVSLLPWLYLFACAVVVFLAYRRQSSWLWVPAIIAGYGGIALVVMDVLSGWLANHVSDRLGLVMAALISFLAMVIINFSRGYLQGEPRQRRYLVALLLTLAAVAVVVTTDNLFWLVAAWISTSLSLHQLLVFYPERSSAQVVAHKKFLVSRLADLCLLSATCLLVHAAGSSSIVLILQWVAEHAEGLGGLGWSVHLAALLMCVAVILKSAQLPVHGWLIQVMEAPTPVSALLHAGLVNLGGFLILRFAPLFSAVPSAQTLLVIVGGLTAVLAALVMMTRISIKVRLAWSTCAQMGFMLMELGLGLYEVALVHLLAHSLYKAHAFLASGGTVNQPGRLPEPMRQGPGLQRALLALPVALALIFLLHAVWTSWQPEHALPLVSLMVLAVGLAPWCFRQGAKVQAAIMLILLPAAYLSWHVAASFILEGAPEATGFQTGLAVMAMLFFISLYCVQALILERPGSELAQRLYPWAYAGFYLDEFFTRLTFRIWPPHSFSAAHLPKGM